MTFNKHVAEQSKCRTTTKQPLVNNAAHQQALSDRVQHEKSA